MSYEIKENEFGILVFGSMPIDDMVALAKVWEKRGHTQMVPGVASAMKAMLAVCAPANVKKWKKHIDDQAKERSQGDLELQWLRGSDTGISSKTIFSVLCRPENKGSLLLNDGWSRSTPWDADDFGRCMRLVDLLSWRNRLPEVSSAHPSFGPIVANWDELCSLFKRKKYAEVTKLLK